MVDVYDRQQSLKLHSYKHAIVLGVGGIGGWVAFNLALSGQVEDLTLIDPDVVEDSNLNRTPFRFCDIGFLKVDALKYMILERRTIEVTTFAQKTSDQLKDFIFRDTFRLDRCQPNYTHSVIIDCRDDVYTDFYDVPAKYYKIGYDGFSITIDGNPRNTAVWGQANGYRVTPSFICPSQLAANLVITDILAQHTDEEPYTEKNPIEDKNIFDEYGRFNSIVTFDSSDLLSMIYRTSIQKPES